MGSEMCIRDSDNGASLTVVWWLATGSGMSSGTLQPSWGARTDANRAVGNVNLADSTDNEWYITGIQFEVGQNATEFEHEPIERTLQKCQRYYVRAGGSNYASIFAAVGFATTTGTWSGKGHIPVPMRAAFTLTTTGTPRVQDGQAGYNASNISGGLIAINSGFSNAAISIACNASGLTLYRSHDMDANNGAALVELDAEL